MLDELWRPVLGYDGYLINPRGVVVYEPTGRYMAICKNQRGISYVGLTKNKRQYRMSLSLLVANHFVSRPENQMFDTPIHLNGDRSDCTSLNLTWRPLWFARKYHQQFLINPEPEIDRRIIRLDDEEPFDDSKDVVTHHGVLETDLVAKIMQKEPVWPSRSRFEIIG